MKFFKIVGVTIFFQIFLIQFIPALSFETEIQMTFKALSEDYSARHPHIIVKKGLAVLPFKEESASAKKAGVGNTIRELISKQIAKSTIFYLVDRDTLEESFKEQRLALSGLIDEETAIKAGNTAGISVFITGSVSELGKEFQITIKIIDVETSEVVGIHTIKKPVYLLIRERDKLAFEYISQYGLGINFQHSFALSIESPRPDYTFTISDVYVNYRPKLWLNFKLGVSYLSLDYREEGTFPAINMQPEITSASNFDNPYISVNPATIEMTTLYSGVDLNWTPTRKINIGFGYSISGGAPVLEQQYNALLVDVNGNYDSAGVGTIEQRFFPVVINRFEIKPQFFISPRMTFGLYFAYMISSHLVVDKTTVYDDYSVRPWTGDAPSAYEQELRDKYYNVSPFLLGNGHNVEGISFTGFMCGISFNFYF